MLLIEILYSTVLKQQTYYFNRTVYVYINLLFKIITDI